MTLRLERHGPATHLVIDRATTRNAFDLAMWQAMPRILAEAAEDPALRLLVLCSAEPGVFCSGADLGELLANRDDPQWRAANQRAINRAQYELARFPLPTIAFVDGDCVGGGCAMAVACDLRIATARARFAITPAKLGLIYPLHDVKLLTDLIGPGQARRLLYTGRLIDADEALRIGLVEALSDNIAEFAEPILAASPHSTRAVKGFIRRVLEGQAHDDERSLAIFAEAFTGPDFIEGVSAFLEKRKPEFRR